MVSPNHCDHTEELIWPLTSMVCNHAGGLPSWCWTSFAWGHAWQGSIVTCCIICCKLSYLHATKEFCPCFFFHITFSEASNSDDMEFSRGKILVSKAQNITALITFFLLLTPLPGLLLIRSLYSVLLLFMGLWLISRSAGEEASPCQYNLSITLPFS